jgi:hypothetical protein
MRLIYVIGRSWEHCDGWIRGANERFARGVVLQAMPLGRALADVLGAGRGMSVVAVEGVELDPRWDEVQGVLVSRGAVWIAS